MDAASHQKTGTKALCLMSGGLDSQLAVCVLREQGIRVDGVFFESPFFHAAAARKAAGALGVELHAVDFTPDIVSILESPRHGFGSCMNPCLDCHARMLRRAGDMMAGMGFDFIATGEVLDERPMSQTRRGLDLVARESGYADLLVRPLSAGLLPPSGPERRGLVDRARLLRLRGRGRRRQFEIAAQYGLKDYPTPAGGCRLTEPNFCARLKDLRDHEGLHGVRSLELLRVGRHFRISQAAKAIVGRNEGDNALLESAAELYDLVLKAESAPGPTVLVPITVTEAELRQAAAICARYSDSPGGAPVAVKVRSSIGERRLEVMPASEEDVARLRI